MERFNRKEIMKRAWNIKRELKSTLSQALKISCSWKSKYQNSLGAFINLAGYLNG